MSGVLDVRGINKLFIVSYGLVSDNGYGAHSARHHQRPTQQNLIGSTYEKFLLNKKGDQARSAGHSKNFQLFGDSAVL